MTTALYRRYRPDTFAAVIGQDHVTGPLQAALRANRVTHAYLFSGPRGCGKTTSARILARCLNCAEGPTDTPCGTCDSCRELATGGPGSLDVVEIDAASHGGVDDARDLRERASFAPVRDRYKVFIIDEAHMVSREGFNALLKLVEEPPEHVKFVFATTEPERVIGTIRSRTHHYPFRLVPPDVLGPYLASLASEEGVDIEQGVYDMVMRAGGGSVRDTLSVLDQLIAGSIDGAVSYSTAVSLLGYTDVALLDEIVDALASGDGSAVYAVVERTVDSGHDPRRFVEDLLRRFRDLLIVAVAGEAAADVLLTVPVDQFERMRAQATRWGAKALSRAADLADEALRQMAGATSPRLQLELLMGRILVPQSLPSAPAATTTRDADSGVLAAGGFGAKEARERLKQSRATSAQAARPSAVPPEKQAPPASTATPAAPPSQGDKKPALSWDSTAVPPAGGAWRSGSAAASTPQAPTLHASSQPPHPQPDTAPEAASSAGQPAVASSAADPDAVRSHWENVLERLSSTARSTWSLINGHARLGEVDSETLILVFPNEALARNLERNGRAEIVSQAVYDVTGTRLKVRAHVGNAIAPAQNAPAAAPQQVSAPSAPSNPAPKDAATKWSGEPRPFDTAASHQPSTASTVPLQTVPPSAEAEPHRAPTETTRHEDARVEDATTKPALLTPIAPWGEPRTEVEPEQKAEKPESQAFAPADKTQPSKQADDVPSFDDEDVEVNPNFGVAAVLDVLGGRVVEEFDNKGGR